MTSPTTYIIIKSLIKLIDVVNPGIDFGSFDVEPSGSDRDFGSLLISLFFILGLLSPVYALLLYYVINYNKTNKKRKDSETYKK